MVMPEKFTCGRCGAVWDARPKRRSSTLPRQCPRCWARGTVRLYFGKGKDKDFSADQRVATKKGVTVRDTVRNGVTVRESDGVTVKPDGVTVRDTVRDTAKSQDADSNAARTHHKINDKSTISDGANGTRSLNNNTISTVYTYTIHRHPLDGKTCIRVNSAQWKSFLNLAHELGYSANELINYFIASIASHSKDINLPTKAPVTFNTAIAKSESNPVINVGEFVARKRLEDLLSKVERIKQRAEKEKKEKDAPSPFTVEKAGELEEEIMRALKDVKKLPPEKLEEVEAALTILRSIREWREREGFS